MIKQLAIKMVMQTKYDLRKTEKRHKNTKAIQKSITDKKQDKKKLKIQNKKQNNLFVSICGHCCVSIHMIYKT